MRNQNKREFIYVIKTRNQNKRKSMEKIKAELGRDGSQRSLSNQIVPYVQPNLPWVLRVNFLGFFCPWE